MMIVKKMEGGGMFEEQVFFPLHGVLGPSNMSRHLCISTLQQKKITRVRILEYTSQAASAAARRFLHGLWLVLQRLCVRHRLCRYWLYEKCSRIARNTSTETLSTGIWGDAAILSWRCFMQQTRGIASANLLVSLADSA